MEWSDWSDKYNYFFRFTSWVYKPYLKRKYHPTERVTLEYKVISALLFVGTWFSVAALYLSFVYFFLYEPVDKIPRDIAYITGNNLADVMRDIYQALKTSIFAHTSFVILMVLTIQARAERDYFKPLVMHSDFLGLIKVIRAGRFDKNSNVIEQDEKQVCIARSNIHDTAGGEDKEIIRIMTASGWDLFGDGPPLPRQEEAPKQKTRFEKLKFWSKKASAASTVDNGYMIDLINGRSKSVEIIMLDPDGAVAKARAAHYLGAGGHRAISSEAEYLQSIRTCLGKLALAQELNPRIVVKLVSDKVPRWKVIQVEGEVWAQPIMDGKRSDHTPLYGFKKTPQSLYHYFFNLFDSYWHSPNSKVVDLKDYLLPKDDAVSKLSE